jgi:putative acetyltransferase
MICLLNAAHADDLDALVLIWERAVRATHHFLAEDDIALLKPLIREQYFAAVSLTVARDTTGRPLGFIGCADCKVEMLFVDPSTHRQGIGRALLEHAQVVENAVEVDVNEQNPAALDFYLRQGFEVVDRSPQDGGGRPFPILHMKLATKRKPR